MKTAFWAPYISDGTIKAICWTLIHSLWIGLVIALLCGIVIAATKKSAAAIRYKLLCSLLLLFVFSMTVTFCIELRSNKLHSLPTPPVVVVGITASPSMQQQVAMVLNQGLLDRTKELLNQNISIIFMVWLLFFMFKSMKMVSGLLYIQRIRNYKTHAVTEEFKTRIEYLSSQIGIGRVVRLVQSELVKVPVAIGWLKPMILLPVGIALQLTPEQLDGILWHELAHIRRRDYLVNILQGLVETVFFFNPGLLWLSSLIRTEREACCDDMVLSRMSHKANYLEALLSFGYGEFNHARYAMSIGSGNQLRDRLKRMISQENKRLSVAEKSVLALGLLLLTAFTTISKDNPVLKHIAIKFRNKSGKVVTKDMKVLMHRLPDGERENDSKPGAREKHTIILTDTAIRFTSVLFKQNDADLNNSDVSAMDDKGNKYHFVVVDGKITSMEINGNKVAGEKLEAYDFILRNIGRELATKKRMREMDLVDAKAADLEARTKYERIKAGAKLPDSVQFDAQGDVLPKNLQYSVDAKRHKFEQMKVRMRNDSIHYYTQLNRAKSVIADLVSENVVTNAEAVTWFGLTENELIVNGNKQPDILHLRLVHKYNIHKDYGLFYGPVKITGTGVFVGDDADNRAYPQGKAKATVALEREKIVSDRLRDMHYRAQDEEKLYNEDVNRANTSVAEEQQMEQKLKQLKRRYSPKGEIDVESAISGVISDLVDANIIKDRSDINFFNLTNTELIVNGKKLSEEIHQKLKNKYLQGPTYKFNSDIGDDPNFGLHFNSKNGTKGLGITRRQDSPW